ncbi:MAG TPA: GNAT family N-acetyltransferase [Allosphingosinicella sp.]|nr:GNAT family N-acetyltransferase [Allosphingosinicella sp.]
MSDVPILHTQRLILREQRPGDTEPMIAAYGTDDFSRFITREGRALNRREAWAALAIVAGSWAVSGYGQWIVEERASGAVAGRIGPWAPEGWPDFEIGWAVVPEHQGKGFAVEGAAAAVVWAHEALGRDYVIHLIDPRNGPSERVAAALGAEVTGTWDSPLSHGARIWTTRWDRFVTTAAYERHVAAAAMRP